MRILLAGAPHDCRGLRLRSCTLHTRLHTGDAGEKKWVRRLRVEPNGDPHLNLGRRESEACRHDADDFRRSVVEGQCLANDVVVTAKMTLPEPVAQDAYMIFAGNVFFRHKGTAHHRIDAQNLEEVSGHLGSLKTFRDRKAGEIHAACGVSGYGGKNGALVAIGRKIRL